jgi:putative sterol carrier protein
MAPTVAEIISKLPQAFLADKAGALDAVVHFKFTGAEAGEWNAVIREGKCEVAQGLPRLRPTITLTADSADFCRLAAGELDPTRAFMEGRVKLSGDLQQARTLLSMFRVE